MNDLLTYADSVPAKRPAAQRSTLEQESQPETVPFLLVYRFTARKTSNCQARKVPGYVANKEGRPAGLPLLRFPIE